MRDYSIRVKAGTLCKNIITKKYLKLPQTSVFPAISRKNGFVFKRKGNGYFVPASKVRVVVGTRSYKATWYQWAYNNIENIGESVGDDWMELGKIAQKLRRRKGRGAEEAKEASRRVMEASKLFRRGMDVLIKVLNVLDLEKPLGR